MFQSIYVYPHQTLLEYNRRGEVTRLGAGRHRRKIGAKYVVVDLRTRRILMPMQEIQVADGTDARVSMAIDVRVVDPIRFVSEAEEPDAVVYLAVQIAVREVVTGLSLDEVFARRIDLSGSRTVIDQAAATVGLDVVGMVVKDVGAPTDVEYARRAAILAQAEAKANLERARAEAAALRIRANSAAVFERHPMLARLRTLEALPHGTKLVLQVPSALDDLGVE